MDTGRRLPKRPRTFYSINHLCAIYGYRNRRV